jgi:predicted nuclease of predicted toxin-antitoxin system
MTLSEFSFLADENIDPAAINFLQDKSIAISSLLELDLIGSADSDILEYAQKKKLVILTQDSDFGSLIHTMNLDFYAIVFLRPGHFSPSVHIETLESLLRLETVLNPPFIIVAENSSGKIKIRIRDKIRN